MPRKYRLKNYDFLLVLLAVLISIYGIFIIGSAKTSFQPRQIGGLCLGIALMVVISLVDYQTVLNFYWVFYILNIVLLLAVQFFGREVNNATRWISIAGIQFQPSEATKFLLILFFAKLIMKFKDKISRFGVLLILIALFAAPWYLVYSQPDLSTSIVIFLIFVSMIFIGGLSWKIIGGVLAVTVPLAIIGLVLVIQPNQQIIKGYQQTRILAWLDPEKYSNQEAYQQQNSITAIGSGQLTGKGYKNNEVASVKNANFISEPQTDFIFAIVGEELGFMGSMAIVILVMAIILRIVQIGFGADDLSGTLVCAGVAAHIGFQTFMNIAVATGLMPNTGIPLPFISYGMTSLVCLFMEIGVVLNIGLQKIRENYFVFRA
ncbi:FtsW/RodA/SpoVE family cell cycle protein [Lachnospiraceae bacterium C1.1]|nr:FtsW/RodA/SpoVE family cell cycle protein [Lachnospiraceae bacterium C1.1]